MKHTVESLMALAFDAMDATRVWAVKNDDLTLASLGRKREALRAALTEALAEQMYEARFKRLAAMEASLAPEDRIAYYVRNPHELDRLIKLEGLAKNAG